MRVRAFMSYRKKIIKIYLVWLIDTDYYNTDYSMSNSKNKKFIRRFDIYF